MDGILLIDKPKGWTSFDVVNKVRFTVQKSEYNTSNKKRFPVGHTGTLDPLATGLLVILLGKYTKRAPELTKLQKDYQVVMKLGINSSTGDEEGEKFEINNRQPSEKDIKIAMEQFKGEISQIPPLFSAIKINGQRAYNLARKGKEVKLESRRVTIYKLNVTSYSYPYVKFNVTVSSGTYVRSLVEDIGKKLETGAYMSDLRRTKIGSFDVSNAMKMDNISDTTIYKSIIILD